MTHPPFIEGPIVRPTPPVSGGIDTTDIDPLRQGVSVKTKEQRANSALPRFFTTKNVNHQIETNLLGRGFLATDGGSVFEDKDKYTAVTFLQTEGSSSFQSTGHGPFSLDGAIEPLTIRDLVTFKSNELFFVRNSIKGNLQEGNEDRYLQSELIMQFVDLRVPLVQVSFLDSNGLMGELSGSVRTVGNFFDADTTIHSFDEGASGTLYSGAPGNDGLISEGSPRRSRITNNDDINAALRGMTGSFDQDFRPIQHKSATAGFVYDNNSAGTDSLAYGGLLRK